MASSALDRYWIPLGAGARVVRISGAIYEALCAWRERRPRRRLFHSALVATFDGADVVVEVTPVPAHGDAEERGVVAFGAVGDHRLGRLRIFRYEVRRWRNGVIPDLSWAIESPVRISDDADVVREVLDAVAAVPTAVWGRDELGLGEMWNSNSVVSWSLARAGVVDVAGVPPVGGRAPGWDAGVAHAGALGQRIR